MPERKIEVKITGTNTASPALQAVAGDIGKLEGAAQRANTHVGGLTGAFGGLGSAITSPLGGLSRMVTGFSQLGFAVFGIQQLTSVMVGLGSSLVSGNAEFERYTVQFGVLLGSTEAATQRLDELTQYAAKTPFELPEVVRADRILQAFGFHAADAADKFGYAGQDIRTIAGDVAAGTGASFEEISTYLGKFASGATGEALMRFAELGVITRTQLAEMGLEFSKSGELMSPLPEATETLLTAMKQKYGGMMDAQSRTFEGMTSNLMDWIGQTKRAIMAPLFEVMKDKLAGLLDFLGKPEVKLGIQGLADLLGRGLSVALDVGGRAIGMLIDAGRGLVNWFRDIKTGWDKAGLAGAMQPFFDGLGNFAGKVIQGLGDLGGMILGWIRQVDWGAVATGMWQGFTGALGVIGNVAGDIAGWLGTQWSQIDWGAVWSGVKDFGTSLWTAAGDIAGATGSWLGSTWARINWADVWSGIKDFGTTLWTGAVDIATATSTWFAGVWGKINWKDVWGGVKNFGTTLWSAVEDISGATTTWLGQQWKKIDWGAVFAQTVNFEVQFGGWVGTVDSNQMGQDLAHLLYTAVGNALGKLGEMISSDQGTGKGSDFGQVIKGLFVMTGSINESIGNFVIGFAQSLGEDLVTGIGDLAGAIGQGFFDLLNEAVSILDEKPIDFGWLKIDADGFHFSIPNPLEGIFGGAGPGGGYGPGGQTGTYNIVPGGLGAYPLTTVMGKGYSMMGVTTAHEWGEDYGVGYGTPIIAPTDVVIPDYGFKGANSWGNQISMILSNGAEIIISHLSGFAETIKDGFAKAGEILGWSGSTGFSSGPHIDIQTILSNGLRVRPGDFFGIPASLGGGAIGGRGGRGISGTAGLSGIFGFRDISDWLTQALVTGGTSFADWMMQQMAQVDLAKWFVDATQDATGQIEQWAGTATKESLGGVPNVQDWSPVAVAMWSGAMGRAVKGSQAYNLTATVGSTPAPELMERRKVDKGDYGARVATATKGIQGDSDPASNGTVLTANDALLQAIGVTNDLTKQQTQAIKDAAQQLLQGLRDVKSAVDGVAKAGSITRATA